MPAAALSDITPQVLSLSIGPKWHIRKPLEYDPANSAPRPTSPRELWTVTPRWRMRCTLSSCLPVSWAFGLDELHSTHPPSLASSLNTYTNVVSLVLVAELHHNTDICHSSRWVHCKGLCLATCQFLHLAFWSHCGRLNNCCTAEYFSLTGKLEVDLEWLRLHLHLYTDNENKPKGCETFLHKQC